jgi:hypothetical protein
MESRSLIELLKLLDEEIDGLYFESCLCLLIKEMYFHSLLDAEEYNMLSVYIHEHKPFNATLFWFPIGEREPRHKFLRKLIKREQRWNRLLQVLKFWHS